MLPDSYDCRGVNLFKNSYLDVKPPVNFPYVHSVVLLRFISYSTPFPYIVVNLPIFFLQPPLDTKVWQVEM